MKLYIAKHNYKIDRHEQNPIQIFKGQMFLLEDITDLPLNWDNEYDWIYEEYMLMVQKMEQGE